LKDFLKLTDIAIEEEDEFDGMFVGVNNTIKVLSTLSNVPANEIEALPMHQMNKLAKKIEFTTALPKTDAKSKIIWKKLDEVTYGDFTTFQMLSKDPIPNLPVIIKAFSKDEITEEQVLDLDVETCFNGFFFLLNHVKVSTKNMITSTAKKYVMQRAKEKVRTLFKRNSKKQIK
jgi:hypothetical protein